MVDTNSDRLDDDRPLIKEELGDGNEGGVDAGVTMMGLEAGPLTPEELPSEIIPPNIAVNVAGFPDELAASIAEQPITPISIPPADIPRADEPINTAIPTTSARSDSPLTSIIAISPPPPSRKSKNKTKPKTPRVKVKEEPIDEDHLDTSPPEFATLTPHGFGEVETQVNNHYVYLFYRFCAERHKMTVIRGEGVPGDQLTTDECMKKERVGNVYRDLDPSSRWVVDEIIGKGDQSNEEICCESQHGCERGEYEWCFERARGRLD
jgi:hypothetical protein